MSETVRLSNDLWQLSKEFSRLGSEKLANLLISAGERSDPLRRVLYVWSAFIIFKEDQNIEKLEKNLIRPLTVDEFKPHDESDSYDLLIYELQYFLNEQFAIPEQQTNVKDLFGRLKPVIEKSMEHLSEDWIWSKALEEMTNTFSQV